MSLLGFPSVGSTAIARLHGAIASSYRRSNEYTQPRNVCASAVGSSASEAWYRCTAPARSPANWHWYARSNSFSARARSPTRQAYSHLAAVAIAPVDQPALASHARGGRARLEPERLPPVRPRRGPQRRSGPPDGPVERPPRAAPGWPAPPPQADRLLRRPRRSAGALRPDRSGRPAARLSRDARDHRTAGVVRATP